MADPALDVRSEPHVRRHALILDAYGRLAPGEGFELINDHDPKPLYYQFSAEFAGEFTWDYLEQGPQAWRVRIGRVAAATPREIGAMIAHHEQLQTELAARTTALATAADNGEDVRMAVADLHDFLTGEVIPHALAEEDAIYRAGSTVERLAPLVDGMLMEHEVLVDLTTAIEHSANGLAAASAATAFESLFHVHVRKENELLLPGLVAAGVDPATLLSDMHAAFEARRCEAAAPARPDDLRTRPGEQVVDTRVDTTVSCAQLTNDALDALPTGDSFVLVADHDPRGIRYMLQAERPTHTTWELLEDGPRRWQARIGKLAAGAASHD